MAAGDVTPGRRVADETHPADLLEADYCLRGGHWWLCTPNGLCGPLSLRQAVTEHPDGSVSVFAIDARHRELGWRGYLETGTWWEV